MKNRQRGKGISSMNIIGKHKKIAVLIAVVTLVLCVSLVKTVSAKSAEQAVNTEDTVAIKKMDLAQSLTLSGTVEGGATYSISSSIVDAEVVSVNVSEGDTVRKGDVIAVLDDSAQVENRDSAARMRSLANRRGSIEVSSAARGYNDALDDKDTHYCRNKNSVTQAKNRYNEAVGEKNAIKRKIEAAEKDIKVKEQKVQTAAKAAQTAKKDIIPIENNLNNYELAFIEAEDALTEAKSGGADQSRINALQKEYDACLTKLKAEQVKYDKLKKIIDKEADAAEELESAKTEKESLEEAYKNAKTTADEYKSAHQKAKEDSYDDNLEQSRNVYAREDAYKTAVVSADEADEGPRKELSAAERELEKCVVRAESDGVVASLGVHPGDIYKGDTIAVINDQSSYRVSAAADQYDISSLADGQGAEITVEPAKIKGGKGKLIHVAKTPMVSVGEDGKASAGSDYKVEALIEQPNPDLRIGMTAKVVVNVLEKKDVLAVPDNCIQTDENGEKYIQVLEKNDKVRNVPVSYGMKTDYYSEIKGKGLKEGMKVIVPSADSDNAEEQM